MLPILHPLCSDELLAIILIEHIIPLVEEPTSCKDEADSDVDDIRKDEDELVSEHDSRSEQSADSDCNENPEDDVAELCDRDYDVAEDECAGKNISETDSEQFGLTNIPLTCLRFDNPDTGNDRKESNRAAAITYIFETFVRNCQEVYTLSEHTCIDEILVSFRGRCSFKMYFPKKPVQYGLKVIALTDAENNYFHNGYLYSGKQSDGSILTQQEKKLSIPSQSVIRLTKPIAKSNRNITADNWFSSVEIAEELKKRGLTHVGTLRENKKEIPIEFLPAKKRDVESSLFGFTKDLTLVSYVLKKNKAVLLISSMHHTPDIEPNNKKPGIMMYNNSTKGGVDALDHECSVYSCERRTNRWAMDFFLNHYILHGLHSGKSDESRFDFMKSLLHSLVQPQMNRGIKIPNLQRELKLTIAGITDTRLKKLPNVDTKLYKRKRCALCPYKKDKKTSYACAKCSKPICSDCSRHICKECSEKYVSRDARIMI
ncbi:hypothetical protein JTB14_033180 [Gonioctena quinquepunctata]|nr:hypothetical protein JTB14_033180 [Gonioctena quinquepunctata]